MSSACNAVYCELRYFVLRKEWRKQWEIHACVIRFLSHTSLSWQPALWTPRILQERQVRVSLHLFCRLVNQNMFLCLELSRVQCFVINCLLTVSKMQLPGKCGHLILCILSRFRSNWIISRDKLSRKLKHSWSLLDGLQVGWSRYRDLIPCSAKDIFFLSKVPRRGAHLPYYPMYTRGSSVGKLSGCEGS
jgi:hypothetical protein